MFLHLLYLTWECTSHGQMDNLQIHIHFESLTMPQQQIHFHPHFISTSWNQTYILYCLFAINYKFICIMIYDIYIYICSITVRIYIYIHVDMIPWCCISLSLCSLPSDLLPATSIPLCLFQIAIAHSERRSAKCCEDCNPPYYLPCSPPATTGFVQQMYKQSTLRWTKTT